MSQESQTAAHQPSSGDVHTGHPTPATYFKVAMILSTITALEVGIFYLDWLGHGIIPILVILSGIKFGMVVMFYMHLKYDAQLFTGMFFVGFGVALGVILTLMALTRFFV